ncbi:peroxisome biogenesis factor 13 [Hemitrygon akajei]|uniref:peroxisome biogenesis factor 13 n=1 Tax=Hemitrygon akajei TaxID=2704970 RepID=UPI003BFA2F99
MCLCFPLDSVSGFHWLYGRDIEAESAERSYRPNVFRAKIMGSQPPPKPWERRIPGNISVPSFQSADLVSGLPARQRQPVVTRIPPPVPPRVSQQTGIGNLSTYRSAYNTFSPAYTPYGSSLYGGYTPYNYGYGGLGYNRFRTDDIPPSRFVRQAEESSRGAFHSIESIVHAFASVSMMLDATFSAVYNSFRAVLDVANHFSRLRVHFTKVLSAFALIRTLKYLYRKLQRLLGLRNNSDVEELWAESAGSVLPAGAEDKLPGSGKSWPIFMFFAVVLGGPYLIWKLLSSATFEPESTSWANGDDDHIVARAEYDFTAGTEEELSFHSGDLLNLAPKEQQPKVRGWLLACLDGQTTGLVPANYVRILGKRRGRKQVEQESIAKQEPQRHGDSAAAGTSFEEQQAVFESAFSETSKQNMDSSTIESINTGKDIMNA